MHASNLDRHIIPRWRSPRATFAHGELDSTGEIDLTNALESHESVAGRLADWIADPGIRTAADLLAVASAANDDSSAIKAAKFLNARTRQLSPELLSIVRETLFEQGDADAPIPTTANTTAVKIASLKRHVVVNPHDAVSYVELARLYSTLGQSHRAQAMMKRALAITDSNRFVVRCAARMYVHQDEPDRAHRILTQSGDRSDPWVVATEIALSTILEKSPRWTRAGSKLLARGRPEFELSELRAAIARLQADAGKEKVAKKLLREAMSDPNENVIAQAQWMASNRSIDVVEGDADVTKRSAEAHSHLLYRRGLFTEALRPVCLWQDDQAFSSRPSALGSFIASCCLNDHEMALEFLGTGLTANPRDVLLLNNQVFSLCQLDRTDEAAGHLKTLRAVAASTTEILMATATTGLFFFRTGRPVEGLQHYLLAIDGFEHRGDRRAKAIALAYLARELQRLDDSLWKEKLMEFEALVASLDLPDLKAIKAQF